jgi:hypothetical protein
MSVVCGSVEVMKRQGNAVSVSAELVTEGLGELWCSDCRTRTLFESIIDVEARSEWACTDCGAAYLDAIDLVVDSDVLAADGVLVV